MKAERFARPAEPGAHWASDLHEWGNRERNALVLNYTAACPLSCDFCCYGCHPKRAEKMPYERAAQLIRQSARYEDFTTVGFTGGEPMLFPDEIIALAVEARKAGKSSTMATAAHWATSRDEVRRLLDPLLANGLNRLNVSFDPSHTAFVPEDHVRNVADVIPEYGIPLYLVSTYYSVEDFEKGDLSDSARGVFHYRKLVAKTGRATKAEIDYGATPTLDDLSCYRGVYHDLVVFYDGKAYPCCSTFNRASPGLVLGDAWEIGFDELRLRLLGSIMLRSIKRGSFATLAGVLDRYDADCAAQIRAIAIDAGPCGFCNKIFRDPALYGRVRAAFERAENDIVAQAIIDLEKAGVHEIELTA